MGFRRSQLRGVSWEEYHYMCRGYLRRCAREEENFRKLASVWGGKQVFEGWKIPELDRYKPDRLPDPVTQEEKERALKAGRAIKKLKNGNSRRS